MLNVQSKNFLKKLLNCSGPSGFELETAAVYREYLSTFAQNVYSDVTGNTVGVVNEGKKLKVMLAGHYDEIGFQVVYICSQGYIYFRAVGGIDKITVPGTEVDILTKNNKRIPGIIGKKPIHLTKASERNNAVELKDLWIDIGSETKEETEKIVTIGDPIAVRSNYQLLGKHRIKSKGMDDKIGAFIVAETLRELSKRKIDVSVYAVGTVQEELGLRGAATSTFGIDPDVGFAVDVGFTTDVPDVNKKELGEISLGEGPIISRNANLNPILHKKIAAAAKKHKIKLQNTAGFRASGGTDTDRMQLTKEGVATALIGIPNRYMHTPVEMCDLRDVESAIKLLTETIASIKSTDKFIPGIN